MSVAGSNTSVRRVLRSASRALSDDEASIAGASVGGRRVAAPSVASRRGRSGRSNRATTPILEHVDENPELTNKRSKAYGAPEESAFAEQMERSFGDNAATNIIAKAVHGADAPILPIANNANQLPDVAEEVETGAGGAGNQAASSQQQTILNLSNWPPVRLIQKFRGSAVPRDIGFLAPAERQHRSNWLKYLLSFVFFLAVCDLYRGPLFGPKYDLVQSRERLQHLQQALLHRDVTSLPHVEIPPHVETPKQQIDYFALGNGAAINPYLTSPTVPQPAVLADQEKLRQASMYCILFGCRPSDTVKGLSSGAPAQILSWWDDSGLQRWCAPSSRGKLQVTIMTKREIAPTELVIEHGTRDTTLLVGTAPRELELWVEIQDEDIRAKVSDAVGRLEPELYETSNPQEDRYLDPEVTLGPNFVPVGRWTYNIYRDQAAQSFQTVVPLGEYGVQSNVFSIRVNSNWGNGAFTCLNRARMYGEDTSGFVEPLEQDPGAS